MRDLLLFLIVMGLVPVSLMRPWIGVVAWFWVGLMVPHSLTWGFMQTFPIAEAIAIPTLLGLFLTRDRHSLPATRELVLLGLFVAHITLTSALAVHPDGAWSFWQHFMKILLITFITPILVYGQKRIVLLTLVITLSIGFYGFKGGIFTISTGGAHSVLGPDGSYLSGNTYIGLAMIMVLPLLLANARLFSQRLLELGSGLVSRLAKPAGWLLYAAFWLTSLSILATYSRGAFLGVLAIAPFVFLHMRRKVLLVVFAVLAVGAIGLHPPDQLVEQWRTIENYEEDRSALQRLQSWGVSWNMALERPLNGMGFGYGGMGYRWWRQYAEFEGNWQHVLSSHSIYFGVLGQHGFVGLAIWLLMIAFTMLTLNRIRREAARDTGQLWLSEYAWAIQVGLAGYLVAGAFLDVAYFDLVYALIALAIIMRRELDEAKARLGESAEPAAASAKGDPAGHRWATAGYTRDTLDPPTGHRR